MNEIEDYIHRLFKDIPPSRRRQEIMQEIIQNLNEKVADLTGNGRTRDQAVKQTIEDFGDIGDLKKELQNSAQNEKSKKAGLSLAFSIWGAVLITAFFLFLNFYNTPGIIWFVYPVFAVIWWPMSLFFHWFKLKYGRPVGLAFSICSFILITALFLFINFYYTPAIIWFVYPVFAAVWWPMTMFFFRLRQNRKESEDDERSE